MIVIMGLSYVVQLGRAVGCHFPLEVCLLPSSTILTSQAFQGSTSSRSLDIVAEVYGTFLHQ